MSANEIEVSNIAARDEGPTKVITQYVTFGKDLVTLLRDFMLFVLAVLLLLFPSAINEVLNTAGFQEGNVAGFKWKARLLETDKRLASSQGAIADLTEQINKQQETLGEAQSRLKDPELKNEIANLEKVNQELNVSSSIIKESATKTIESNAPLVARVEENLGDGGVWAVVFGSDDTLSDARHEIQAAAGSGIPNPAVYFRQGRYRSVSVVGARTDAQELVSKAKQQRSDSYLVNFTTWCSNTIDKIDYKECRTN